VRRLWLASLLALASPAAAAPILVDGFEAVDGWSARPADGVELHLSTEPGLYGNALRLDFNFLKGGGYAVAHKDLSLDLPANYRFRFRLRGATTPENLEFKLIDSSGANVWWSNQRDFKLPATWDSVTLKKRHIGFAWGPAGGGDIHHVAAIEFAITAGTGGQGTVWLDQLTLEPLPPADATPPKPTAKASSVGLGTPAATLDGDPATGWRPDPGDRRPWLELDLGQVREFGGLVVDWQGRDGAPYDVQVSEDGSAWRTVRHVLGARTRDYLYLPESETRFLRIRKGADTRPLTEISIQPLAWSSSLESFYQSIAADAPRGSYPRGITGQQSYWTVVGQDRAREEGLLGEDGALETGKRSYSIEPFLYAADSLHTWADAVASRSLDSDIFPIPTVRQTWGDFELTTTAFGAGKPEASSIYLRYRVRNRRDEPRSATFFLAVRPFQVNPPTQLLNTPGGTAPIRSLEFRRNTIKVNGDRGFTFLTLPKMFGAAPFDEGDITEYLRRGQVPPHDEITDAFEHASGALAYALDLAPGDSAEIDLVVPLNQPPAARTDMDGAREVAAALARERLAWSERDLRVTVEGPFAAQDELQTMRAQLGYILVNRDSAGIQPGSRSYERSWIRDGALTSTALLRLGQADVVKEFIEWFAPYLYPEGKVPCCVDYRGSDPVPEHDSSGEFIYLVAEYLRYTGDRELAERMWPAVARAAGYLDSLRQTRRTAEWRTPANAPFFGLLPPSISHEGYSAKPMHSYWDDLFALRGFKDATYLAEALGRPAEARRWAGVRDEFAHELSASIRAAMGARQIDYIPGAADLGDFDATSTTIALDPVQAGAAVPDTALRATFEKYWKFFVERRASKTWDAFTPYEIRNVGAFVRLGWRDRVQEALQFFMEYRRPAGWKQWAEVVWRDARSPHFIGDMPHTWVGSDYVRSLLDCFAYEREADSTLVLGAGVPWEWVIDAPGVRIGGLPTPYGKLSYTMRAVGRGVDVLIEPGLRVPPGGIVVSPPSQRKFRRAMVNGAATPLSAAGEITVRSLPAAIQFAP